MALSPLPEAPVSSHRAPAASWAPLPQPDQVDVTGALLWHPTPDVTVRAHRVFGDRWEVLTTTGTTTRARVVGFEDVAGVLGSACA